MQNLETYRPRSISRTLSIGLIITLVLVAGLSLGVNFVLSSLKAKAELETRVEEYISALTDALRVPLWNYSEETIAAICASYAQNELVAKLLLEDQKGIVFFKTEKVDHRLIVSRSRDIFYEDSLIGRVHITLASGYYTAVNRQLFQSFSLIIVIMIGALLVMTGVLLRQFLKRPMSRFIKMVEMYGAGDSDAFKQGIPYSELRPLVDVLDEMGEKIASQMKSIRELNEDLERRVEERTAELNKLSETIKQSPVTVMIADKNGAIEYVNPAFSEVTGYTAEEAIGQNPRILKSSHHPDSFYKGLWDTILSGKTWRGELLNRKKNDEEFWESTSISAIKNDEGEITHFVAVKQDITDRKRAEQAIMESRAKYRDLVENANCIIFQMDTQGKITFFNRFAQVFFGYSETEILGRNIVGTIVSATDSAGRNLEIMIQDLVKHPERYADNENENIRRNGELAWVAWTNRAIYDDEGRLAEILCIGIDRTEQKKAEAALRESRAAARGLLDATQESLLLLDSEGIIIAGNHTAAHRLQKSTEELIGTNLFDLLPQDILESRRAHFNGVLKTGIPADFEDIREGIVFYNSYFPVQAKTGEVTGVAIFAQDISERKRAEEAVQKREKEYRTLFENASVGILVAQDQKFRFVNPQMEKLLAYKQTELTSRSIADFFHPDDRNMIQERHEKRLKGESVPDVYNTRIVDAHGNTKWVEVKVVPIQWDDRPAALGFMADITERKRAEEELKRNVEELERFNKLAIGRELKMIQFKEEINELLAQLNQDKKYKIVT